jgi:hypothetical protein
VEQEIDAQIENLLSAKRTVKAVEGPHAGIVISGGTNKYVFAYLCICVFVFPRDDIVPVPKDKLQLARQLAAKLAAKTTADRRSEVERTTEGFVRGTMMHR